MLLITNGTVVTPSGLLEESAVYSEKGIIKDIGLASSLKDIHKKARVLDARGGIIMPGLTNVHSHLYSTFARGMSLSGTPAKNFLEILEKLWWRLDKELYKKDVYLSALVPLIECVRCGTTTIIDHHASYGYIGGSLDKIAEALQEIPVRASLCFEVSDRNGPGPLGEALKENCDFISSHKKDAMVGAMFGLHASFTVSDDTLKTAVSEAGKLGVGFHVHAAEGESDVVDTKKKYGMGVVERFSKMGVLGPKSMLAHCIHITEGEMDILAKTKTNVAHNPESNMNNAVGAADIIKMLSKGVMVGLGTDGMTMDMFQEVKFAHLLRKHVEKDPRVGFMESGQLLLENNYKIISNLFSKKIGTIEAGAAADIIVLDYRPPTPLTRANLLGHLLYGVGSGSVASTVIDGKVLMENRELKGIDEERITAHSREAAKRLWGQILKGPVP